MHPVAVTELDERERAEATRRWQVLCPVVQDAVPLAATARDRSPAYAERRRSRSVDGLGSVSWPEVLQPNSR